MRLTLPRILFTILLTGSLIFMQTPATAQTPENTLYMDVPAGRVVIEMYPDKAPNHVARIKELTREGYYDGKLWHRVIDGFMAQTGSPQGNGIGGSDKPDLEAEFNDIQHVRGVASMARTQNPNSANAQFFIMLADAPHLDGQYTAWGRVIEGMENIDALKKGDSARNGTVDNPDAILKMQVAADAE